MQNKDIEHNNKLLITTIKAWSGCTMYTVKGSYATK